MMDPERGTEESFGGVRVRIDELEEASKTGLDVPRKSAPVASGKEKNTGPSDNEPDGPSTPSTVPRVTLPPAPEYHDFPDAPVAVIMSKDVSSDPPVTTAMSNGNASGPPNSSVSVGVLPSKPSGTATTTNDPQTWLHEIPQAGATPTNTGARPPPVQRDEPGWMTSLYLGESGRRFPFSVPSRLRPYVSWIPVLLRLLQAVFALVAFATAASMSHPKTCVFENADNGTDNTSSNSTSTVPADLLEQLVNNAMCLPGRTYKQFSSLEFLVVINACAFFWALCYFFGDLLCLGKVRLGREVSGTSALSQKKAFENASRWGVPSFAFWGDLVITFLTLAAACAVAGLRGGLSDLDANYCDGVGKDWCHKMATAAAFGMCTFVLFLPSVALNTANAVGPW